MTQNRPAAANNTAAGAWKIFIDGDAGTTGLEIRERLASRADFELVSIARERRKDIDAKREILASVDVAILCLPDEAAKETVALCDTLGDRAPRILDASTAHRVAAGWVYGFPELCKDQPAASRMSAATQAALSRCCGHSSTRS
jgi:N-acetyl-gamma-glutamyl-phosphate reductase